MYISVYHRVIHCGLKPVTCIFVEILAIVFSHQIWCKKLNLTLPISDMITFRSVLPDYNRIRPYKPEAKPNVCCRSRCHHYQRLHYLDSGYLVVIAFAENKPCMKTNMSRADSINKDLSLLVASPDELQKPARLVLVSFPSSKHTVVRTKEGLHTRVNRMCCITIRRHPYRRYHYRDQ